MENTCLEKLIIRLEKELAIHKKKFADNPVHRECPQRIAAIINMLKTPPEAKNSDDEQSDESGIRGDEFDSARLLYRLASELEKDGEKTKGVNKEAQKVRKQGRDMIASQLNEFDGFSR